MDGGRHVGVGARHSHRCLRLRLRVGRGSRTPTHRFHLRLRSKALVLDAAGVPAAGGTHLLQRSTSRDSASVLALHCDNSGNLFACVYVCVWVSATPTGVQLTIVRRFLLRHVLGCAHVPALHTHTPSQPTSSSDLANFCQVYTT